MENVLAGYNSSIFAYGQTGSGKTYTMLGCIPSEAQVMPPEVCLSFLLMLLLLFWQSFSGSPLDRLTGIACADWSHSSGFQLPLQPDPDR